MARFAPDKPDRWGHMAFDMRFDEMEVVLELVKDRVANLEFREVPAPGEAQTFRPEAHKPKPAYKYNHFADEKIWEDFLKPVFVAVRTNGQGDIHIWDKRLEEVMKAVNRKPSGITPLLSWLARSGKVVRTGKGRYKLT